MAIGRSLKPLYAKLDVQLGLCRFVCYVVRIVFGDIHVLLRYLRRYCCRFSSFLDFT